MSLFYKNYLNKLIAKSFWINIILSIDKPIVKYSKAIT